VLAMITTEKPQDVLSLAEEAGRCRRLAAHIDDESRRARLLVLAIEYEARIAEAFGLSD
jgi:hypothetical protein